jgi:DNA-binding CsgD family transcriptional regulator
MSHASSAYVDYDFDVFNHINSPVFVIDIKGTWLFINNVFEEVLGFHGTQKKNCATKIKTSIHLAFTQECIERDAAISAPKTRQIVLDAGFTAKKYLKLCFHGLRDDQGVIGGYIGIIELISRDVSGAPPLTRTELRILSLIAKGYATKEIANLLGSSSHTIANHQKSVYKKLSAHSKIAAINEGKKQGLLDE